MMNRILDIVCVLMIIAGGWSFVNVSQASVVFTIGVVILIVSLITYFIQKFIDELE